MAVKVRSSKLRFGPVLYGLKYYNYMVATTVSDGVHFSTRYSCSTVIEVVNDILRDTQQLSKVLYT